jgi:hypothetical protein
MRLGNPSSFRNSNDLFEILPPIAARFATKSGRRPAKRLAPLRALMRGTKA